MVQMQVIGDRRGVEEPRGGTKSMCAKAHTDAGGVPVSNEVRNHGVMSC